MAGALSNIRILEIGQALSAPFAVQLLADFGAEVIKVERPGTGDLFRQAAVPLAKDREGHDADSSGFLAINRNKRSLAIDFTQPAGAAVVRKLAATCDVVLENLKTGDLARYGLDYASLKRDNPRLVYLSLTGFGQTGPYAARGGLDSIFQSMSGVMSVTGEPDGPPQRVGYLLADTTSGMYAALGTMIALYSRDANGGQGQHIDLGMLEAMISAMSTRVQGYLTDGKVPTRVGSSAGAAPTGPLPCKDGELSVSAAMQTQFPNFCKVIGRPDLMADPRFNTLQGRTDNKDALVQILSDLFRTRAQQEWFDQLVAGGVLCAPIYDIGQALADPQTQARGLIGSMPHPTLGELPIVHSPLHMSGTPAQYRRPPPRLGEHNDEILAQEAGLGAEEIAALKRAKVV